MGEKIVYNPWPNGKVPHNLLRPELDQLYDLGYRFDDAREVVDIFEKKVADFAGSKYAVAVDCCTHAIELSFRYLIEIGELELDDEYELIPIIVPKNTYVSAAHVLENLTLRVKFEQIQWSGIYPFTPYRVIDGAVRWMRGMYEGNNALQCLSFQIKKRIPIGRGGMILTDDKEAVDWLRLARYDGRDMSLPYDHPNHVKMKGYHYYMTPEDAARGLILMYNVKEEGDTGNWTMYPDITQWI